MSTVLLAGGPTLVRAAMARVIEASGLLDVVGQAADETRLRAALTAPARPDLVLLDRTLRGGNIAQFAEAVRIASKPARTIVFGIADAREADACLRAGATGVLAADVTAAQLVAATETVLRGGLVVVLETAPAVTPLRPRTAGPDVIPPLSGRERQVLTLLAHGHEAPAIADALGIRPLTVKTHIANLLAKIGVRHRGQAIAFAYEHGIVTPSATLVDPFVARLPAAS
ncbi:DNA-binding response regulator [Streptomyces tendae]|uniref:LuxR C-terminal-related transcriptional regulator n=1 Tax=Streptomyces tendae TaxID=1932 RepID=UPI001674B004|nr:response regulator transcription factor [Streptomyces tendae]GHB03000.1 DNA-binding response regulator [Streptomyces tendae]